MSKYRISHKILSKIEEVEPTAECKVQVAREKARKAQEERDELQELQAAIFEPYMKKKSNGKLKL